MSAHYSRFSLNTFPGTDYFQAHLPKDYPLELVLQKSRCFRRLPPNLRRLAQLSKARAVHQDPEHAHLADGWYDDDGNELDPNTRQPLTDAQIDADWATYKLTGLKDFVARDIPVPYGGFPDPTTWEPTPVDDGSVVDALGRHVGLDSAVSRKQLVRDVKSRGLQRTAEEYGVTVEELRRAIS